MWIEPSDSICSSRIFSTGPIIEVTYLCALDSWRRRCLRLRIELVGQHTVNVDFALSLLDGKLFSEAATATTNLGSSLIPHDVDPNG
jgi:hypothetical protein